MALFFPVQGMVNVGIIVYISHSEEHQTLDESFDSNTTERRGGGTFLNCVIRTFFSLLALIPVFFVQT